MVTGLKIAHARNLQIMGRPLSEIADRIGESKEDLDRALWNAAGISSNNLRTFWAKSNFAGSTIYPPSTGPIPA